MKCKDCSCCHSVVYERYRPADGYVKTAKFMCYGVQEPFEVDNLNAECPAYPEKREQESECPYCNKNKYNGGFHTQAVHVKRNKIEYTQIETKFCPNCGRKLG